MSASERSKSSARRGFGVAPSPLNGVKRDLALVLVGVLSALWVVVRTRRMLAVLGSSDGPKQE